MCAYTHLKSKNLKKIPRRGWCATLSNVPNYMRIRRKGYNTNQQRFRHVMLHTGRI